MKDDAQRRGIKRKRFEPVKEKDIGAKVVGKLHHDLKEVRKAAKKAKIFETQKLVKKLKGLRLKDNTDPNITECESQLEQLKIINHEAIANTALRTKLTKDKHLSDNELMQVALSKELASNLLVPANGGTSAAKIQSRLLSSKILASEVAAAVEDLRSVIIPSTDSQDGDISADVEESLPKRPKKLKKMESIAEDEDIEMDLGEAEERDIVREDEDAEAQGWESGTVGDDEKEPDDGWESGSIAGDSEGYMDEDMPTDSEDGVPMKTAPKAGPSKANTKTSAGQSTFLPTLSTGFIRGSDSEWSESEAQAAEIPQKKNRRGQRARQAIWEKKYGRNANHKKKEASSSANADVHERGRKRWPGGHATSDRPSNRPAYGAGRKGHKPAAPTVRTQDSGWDQRGAPTSAPVASSGSKDSRPLHPSWEAKKKMNERQSAAIVPSTATRKIKFS